MAIRLTSHLHKNRYGVFGFRLVIPRDLRLLFPQNEVRISLRTTNKTIAASLALRLTVVTTNYLNRIRRAPTLDEAMATGKEFLEALSGTTFDSQTEKLEELILLSDGESRELLKQLFTNTHYARELKTDFWLRIEYIVLSPRSMRLAGDHPKANSTALAKLFLTRNITPKISSESSRYVRELKLLLGI